MHGKVNLLQEKTINNIIDWIELNLEKNINIDVVAKKSGYTKWYLQRLFKHYTGISLGYYIRSRRLSRAAIDLKSSNCRILDISVKYNFESQQTFSNSFKRMFNMSPNFYRKSSDINLCLLQLPFNN